MKKITFWLISFLMSSMLYAQHTVTPRNLLTQQLTATQAGHLVEQAGQWKPFPAYRNRDAWERLPAYVREHYIRAGEKALDYEWPSLPASLYIQFAQNGNRSNYQAVFSARRNKLKDLVLAEMMEGEGRFMTQIMTGVWLVCEETSWVIPAHLSLQKDGATPLPNYAEHIIDLTAAETGNTLAWIHYLLKEELDKLTPLISQRIEEEVQQRILIPGLERKDFWWMGYGGRFVNNWNPWIASNWLSCVLLMEKDPQRKVEALEKIAQCVDHFINYYPEDGGCDEGPAYWGHAGGSLLDCLTQFKDITDGKVNLFTEPLVRKIGQYIYKAYISSGNYFVNFADAPAKAKPYPDLIFQYGKSIEDEMMMSFAAFLAQSQAHNGQYLPHGNNMRRLLTALFQLNDLQQVPAKEPLSGSAWLPDTQVFTAREHAGSTKGFYVAAKGGHNNESHNHNDVGNFILYYDGKPVVIDVGVETYSKKTFSRERYSIWTMQSGYHSLPTINGVMQKNGNAYKARGVQFSESSKQIQFSLDIAKAYPEQAAVSTWKRSVQLKKGKNVTVTEQYALKEIKGETFISLMTPCQVVIDSKGKILFTGESTLRLVYDAKQIIPEVEKVAIEDKKLQNSWGKQLNRLVLKLKNPKLKQKVAYSFEKVD
ncbi:heparinase II/III family protein [Rapidithrix thailandica]|uniref:Heparinase II/III family protein n=1 Tax=Rapidithrix thailandica TaxID=413964 RepID=A0AAW9S5B7_9BACT